LLQSLGYEIFIVTNQSGVGRGYFSLENVYQIHKQLQNDLRAQNLKPYKDFAICPHSPDENCNCRKPSGKMIKDLIEKYHLKADECYMVGDKIIDAEAGKNAGIHGVIIRTQAADGHLYFKNLLQFAESLKK
jgi:D-glycero-D-manno-heptose 1,7-bisphosphate phosphatase